MVDKRNRKALQFASKINGQGEIDVRQMHAAGTVRVIGNKHVARMYSVFIFPDEFFDGHGKRAEMQCGCDPRQ